MFNPYIVHCLQLFHLGVTAWRSGQYLLNHYTIKPNVVGNSPVFDSNCTNIGQIADLTAAGERADTPAQCTY